MPKFRKRNTLLPIFLTIFIDLLGFGMVIPVFALLFLDPTHGILPNDFSFATKALILGFLTASYPIAQFFGAPILGALSDRLGRKKVLVFSLLGTAVGYILFAIGIWQKNIPLIFASRMLDGFTGGNFSVATSAIADISSGKDKVKNFGLVGVAFGLGFILGPVVGGRLSDASLVSWFDFSTPFLFAGLLATINTIFVYFWFKETLHTKIDTRVSWLTGFHNLKRAFELKDMRVILLTVFLLACGFNIFAQFFQVYLIDKFQLDQVQIGNIFAYLGLWIAISQGLIIRPLAAWFSAKKILSISLLIMAVSLPAVLMPDKVWVLFVTLPFLAVFYGLTQPSSTTIVSDLTTEDSQGEVMGINQSIQAVTQAIPPIVAGVVASIDVQLPIIVGGISVFLGWLIFTFMFKPTKKEQFTEVS